MMNFSEVKNLQWANAEQTAIDCMVTFEHIGEVPFTANVHDTEDHGREIFHLCEAGNFGHIAAYVPPPEPEPSLTQMPASEPLK